VPLARGGIAVIAEPADAEIFVDGISRGRGVVVLGEIVPRVAHRVEVRMAGIAPVVRSVVVQPGRSETVRVNLTALLPKGDILFLGDMRALVLRRDTSVFVDGQPARVEQGLVRDITPGTRKITIVRREFPQFGAVTGVPRETRLWERTVKIAPGAAASFNSDDYPVALRRAAPPKSAVAAPPSGEFVRLTLTLLDSAGDTLPAANVAVSFDGVALRPLADGSWPLPVGRAGVLRVEAPGHLPDERRLSYSRAGGSFITCVLRAARAEAPAPREWRSRIRAVSLKHGLLSLAAPLATPAAKPGQRLLLSSLSRQLRVRLVVAEVKSDEIVCQIAPGQSAVQLPVPGDEAFVSARNE
jgi:hypothetical protein